MLTSKYRTLHNRPNYIPPNTLPLHTLHPTLSPTPALLPHAHPSHTAARERILVYRVFFPQHQRVDWMYTSLQHYLRPWVRMDCGCSVRAVLDICSSILSQQHTAVLHAHSLNSCAPHIIHAVFFPRGIFGNVDWYTRIAHRTFATTSTSLPRRLIRPDVPRLRMVGFEYMSCIFCAHTSRHRTPTRESQARDVYTRGECGIYDCRVDWSSKRYTSIWILCETSAGERDMSGAGAGCQCFHVSVFRLALRTGCPGKCQCDWQNAVLAELVGVYFPECGVHAGDECDWERAGE
jgi:hypothetical protein